MLFTETTLAFWVLLAPCTHKVRAVDNSISKSFASILFVTVTLVITFGPNCSSAAVNKYLGSSFMPDNASMEMQ